MPEEPKKDPFVIRMADFSQPRPFKTVQGAFHPYTYIPFVGWLSSTEAMLLIALLGIALAVALPQPGLARKALAFVMVPVGLAGFIAAIAGVAWVVSWLNRRWFLRFGRARLTLLLADTEADVRRRTADELASWGADAADSVPELVLATKDADDLVRDAAVRALGKIGPAAAGAVPALTDRLADEFLAPAAARALGAIGPAAAGAAPALIRALLHPEKVVRSTAADALGKLGPEAAVAVPALTEALRDPEYLVRSQAAGALGGLGALAARAVPVLAAGVEDKESGRQFIRALGEIGSPEAVAALTALLKHPEPGHREEAERALQSSSRPSSK